MKTALGRDRSAAGSVLPKVDHRPRRGGIAANHRDLDGWHATQRQLFKTIRYQIGSAGANERNLPTVNRRAR